MNVYSKKLRFGFLLSALIHLLLIFIFFLYYVFYTENIKKNEFKQPYLYTPSYLYQETSQLKTQPRNNTPLNQPIAEEAQIKQTAAASPPSRLTIKPENKAITHPPSFLTATHEYLKNNQYQSFSKAVKYEDPVYMIGDRDLPPDPLIRLLAYALSAHFQYPPVAGKFGITGRTIIGMTLYPDGHLANIQILDSSGDADLDHAALYAVNAAPIIKKAKKFITAPKHFIIGFIFKTHARG